jgi:hypothetical protein
MRSCNSTRGHLRWIARFFGGFFWIFGGMLFAREAEIRTTLEVKGDVWVGQGVTLVVELLSPGFFAGSPTFYLPRVPEVLILQPDKRPVLGSENIHGASYTIQRHELTIFAQRAGQMAIPSFEVRFSTREGAAAPIEHLLRTDAVSVDVKLPPGAEGLATLISARELKATEFWQPDPGAAKAGDAFTRTIIFSAPDVPAMAFPPFAATDIAGLGVYPNTPRLLDQSERGTIRGERKDTITYVCKRPGRFVVPAARFTWWDLDHHQLREVDFPSRTFEVAANPVLSGPAAASRSIEGRNLWAQIRALGVVAGLIALAGIGWWISRRRPDWCRSISFWRPVHLAPLNPTASTSRESKLQAN